MKISTKILLGFSIIIILGITQLTVTYKLQGDILNNTKQIKDVEAPIILLAQQGSNYGSVASDQLHSVVLHAQKGDYRDVIEHKMFYGAVEEKLNDIFNKDMRMLLNQSNRSQEEKDNMNAKLKETEQLNLLMFDLGNRAFAAIDKKDFETAYSLVVSGDYEKYQKEVQLLAKDFFYITSRGAVDIENSLLRKSQQVIYFNLMIAILLIIVTLLILLSMRSFIEEQYKLYKLLYESSGDAMMTLEPPDWNFTDGNSAAIKLFNLKDEKQFTSLTPGDLSPEKQPDGQISSVRAKEMIDQAMREGSAFFEWTHKKYEGEDFLATVLLSRIETKDKTYLQATVRDITEDRKKDDLIEFKNIILSTQQETSLDGILVVDENGKILSYNKNFVDMWGIPLDVIKSKSDERALQSVMDKLTNPEEFIDKVKHLYKARKEKSRDNIFLKDGKVFNRYSAPNVWR